MLIGSEVSRIQYHRQGLRETLIYKDFHGSLCCYSTVPEKKAIRVKRLRIIYISSAASGCFMNVSSQWPALKGNQGEVNQAAIEKRPILPEFFPAQYQSLAFLRLYNERFSYMLRLRIDERLLLLHPRSAGTGQERVKAQQRNKTSPAACKSGKGSYLCIPFRQEAVRKRGC